MTKSKLLFIFILVFILANINLQAQEAELSNLIDLISNTDNFDGSSAQISGAEYSMLDENIISFYRQVGDYKQLWLFNKNRRSLKQISTIETKLNEEDILDFDGREANYLEDEINWCPVKIKGKQWFAFVSAGEYSNWDIYLGEVGSHQYIKLTNNRAVDSQPVWSPDGNRIAFVSARSGNGDIYVIDNIKLLINHYYTKRYNANVENKLIFDISSEIEADIYSNSDDDYVRLIQLTDNANEELYPSFSPSGQFLAITSKEKDDGVLNHGISIINLDGFSSPKRFTNSRKTESKPVWTPDGKYIIYYSSSDIEDNRKDIFASKFENFGDLPSRSFSLAQNVQSSSSSVPKLTLNDENDISILYKSLDAQTDEYSIWIAPLRHAQQKSLLFAQKSFIDHATSYENQLLVTRQVGDNSTIGVNFSNKLNKPKKKLRTWTGEISKSKTLYYYIGGGALLVGGVIAWLIIDDDVVVEDDPFSLGTPPNPGDIGK